MDPANFAIYRLMLESKRLELIANENNSEAILVEKVADSMDDLVLSAQRDLAIDTLNRCAGLLSEVSQALLRIADGSYGICLNCGAEIPERRLNALPWAALCLSCQQICDVEAQLGRHASLSDAA